jgi:hypothetical protein
MLEPTSTKSCAHVTSTFNRVGWLVGRVEIDVELSSLQSVAWSVLLTNHLFACLAIDLHLPFPSTEHNCNTIWRVSNVFVLKITVSTTHDIKFRLAARSLGSKMWIPLRSPCVIWYRQKHSSRMALHSRRLAVIWRKVNFPPMLKTYVPANVYAPVTSTPSPSTHRAGAGWAPELDWTIRWEKRPPPRNRTQIFRSSSP